MTAPVNYLPIPGFQGYRIGDDGSVWSRWRKIKRRGRGGRAGTIARPDGPWRRMKTNRNTTNGYVRVTLRRDRRSVTMKVHKIVLDAFCGPRPNGREALHRDGTRWNCALSNLRWGTKSENQQDSVRHGTRVDNRGERSGNAKLSEDNVRSIRALRAAGMTYQDIADRFGVCISQTYRIVKAQRWAHV